MIKRFSFGATALTLGLLFVQLFSARVLLRANAAAPSS
jgi:hypothetical protein